MAQILRTKSAVSQFYSSFDEIRDAFIVGEISMEVREFDVTNLAWSTYNYEKYDENISIKSKIEEINHIYDLGYDFSCTESDFDTSYNE